MHVRDARAIFMFKQQKLSSKNVIARLTTLAKNLWWSWNPDAQALFASMDPLLWKATSQNPLKVLRLLSPERRALLESDEGFAASLTQVEKHFIAYMTAKPWYVRQVKDKAKIAYFCAEFAVHESLPQYSGGLGVLAGDHIKSASDLGIPMTGVGLLYRCGYYTQQFNSDGSTKVIYPQINFDDCPIHDTGKSIGVPMGKGSIKAKIWRQDVGRVSIFLMDCDVPENKPSDRDLTKHLYGGDREYRIRQEILLGVGGLLTLEAVGIKPTVHHMNEGHAAFAALELLAREVKEGVRYAKAIENVRAHNVFTTHTPVPAGNDRFDPKLAMKYIGCYGEAMGLSREQLLALGREDESNTKEEFCMTVLTLKLARQCNGVAALHGEVSRGMWVKVFGAKSAKDVPIGHVTNGIHSETWLAPEMRNLYDKYLKPNWIGASPDHNPWSNAHKIPQDELWAARNMLRARLINFIRTRLAEQTLRQRGKLDDLIAAAEMFDEHTLTIGFARRFATYKRAPLVFNKLRRIAKILGNEDRPVQIVFAGKAHPKDLGGQAFAQEIYRHARENGFVGRVALLEDYDMLLGRMLTSGADVWLNNPLRPQEASGTSGMKPPLHGGLNCSILDGWWPEAFNHKNGWAIGDGREFADSRKQDAYDASCIYDLLEKQIIPAFYTRDKNGIPAQWVKMMVESMKTVCQPFSTNRMLGDYVRKYYLPAHRG
jgi:starch phosphorylase